MSPLAFDALLVVSFGGPEGPDDVVPFLENVLRGRDVPRERLVEVAGHYYRFGGVSPIQTHNRELVSRLRPALAAAGMDLPVYWGNRNWHPFLTDTLREMRADGVAHAAAWVTSPYSSYSGCRQYLDDIERARSAVGADAPVITKVRPYFDHPGFVEPWAQSLTESRAVAGSDAPVLFSAHSIPASMGASSDYQSQLLETASLV